MAFNLRWWLMGQVLLMVLLWGTSTLGLWLRGIPLALVLGLPEQVPRRDEIVIVSFAVVAFSIFVHGMTIAPLLRRLGEVPSEEKTG